MITATKSKETFGTSLYSQALQFWGNVRSDSLGPNTLWLKQPHQTVATVAQGMESAAKNIQQLIHYNQTPLDQNRSALSTEQKPVNQIGTSGRTRSCYRC